MFAAAEVWYHEQLPLDEPTLRELLSACVSFACTLTEWRGFATVVPQVRVATDPVLTIQREDDPEAYPEQLQQRLETDSDSIPRERRAELLSCNALLAVMAEADQILPSIANGVIRVTATTVIDPKALDVLKVLSALSDLLDGWVYDCLSDGWLIVPTRRHPTPPAR
jgi:hypothetical protein